MSIRMTILPKLPHCCHCGDDILPVETYRDANPEHPESEEVRHVRDCPLWEPRGPISDGTLPCPERRGDHRCRKPINKGWHENEGHSGGHWFEPDGLSEAMRSGHYDAHAAVSGLPFMIHQPHECPGSDECSTARFDSAAPERGGKEET